MMIRMELFIGVVVYSFILDIVCLRIEVFWSFFYLYEGDMEYEWEYL